MASYVLLASLVVITPVLAISSSCFFLPNIHLLGGTYDEFSTNDIKDCCIKCANSQCCIAYSYNIETKRCYLKSAISESEENDGVISGIRANSHGGMGSRLRNIRIEGSKTNAVVLDSAEDCLQYCTAYGIYSWSPARPEEGRHSAECTCMQRIASIRYYHGAQSAIFPVSNMNFLRR